MNTRGILAAAVCLLAPLAPADPWELGLHANYMLGGNVHGNESPGLGGQLVYRPHERYSMELALSQYETDADMALSSLVLTARLHPVLFPDPADFHGGLGIGWYTPDNDQDSALRFNAALGLAYRLSRHWRVFGDYRYSFMSLTVQDPLDHGLLRFGVNYEL